MRGAGAREAPPLTITIDAPRIMKIMVLALMDIGRGRAGPERRPPAPAPPRPRPDAEPPPPLQRSARRAPTAAGRGGGAGPARGRGRGAPGVLGRPARALAAPAALRSALGSASRSARGAAPAPSPRGLPRARLPGGTSPPAAARPRDAGRTPPRGPQGPLAPIWPVPALAACPVPPDHGPRPVPTRRGDPGEAPGFLPLSSSPLLSWRPLLPARPGSPGEGLRADWSAPSLLRQEAAFSGGAAGSLPGRSLRSHGHMAQGRGPTKAKGSPTAGAGPASAPALLRGAPRSSEARVVALIWLPHVAGRWGGVIEPAHHPQAGGQHHPQRSPRNTSVPRRPGGVTRRERSPPREQVPHPSRVPVDGRPSGWC